MIPLLLVFLWTAVGLFIYFVSPQKLLALPTLLLLLFLALFFTLAHALKNTRRGLIATSTIIIFLILRLAGLGHVLNLLLLLGVAITLEIYLSSK